MKGPLIAKRKNEGLPLTGDELCWHERKTPIRWKSWSSIIPDKTICVGVGEARTTEMALGTETWELNATHTFPSYWPNIGWATLHDFAEGNKTGSSQEM